MPVDLLLGIFTRIAVHLVISILVFSKVAGVISALDGTA